MTWTPPAFTPGVIWRDSPSTATSLDAQNLTQDAVAGATYAAEIGTSVVAYFETGSSPVVPVGIVASKYLSPSGSDDSVIMTNALTSFAPFAFPVIILGPGTFLWNSQVPAIVRNTPTLVIGAGPDKTFVRLSSAAPRFLDCPYVADYDTYTGITIQDLTVDANNLSPAATSHLVIGNLSGGTFAKRMNVSHVRVRRVNSKNVPTNNAAASPVWQNVSFGSKQAGTTLNGAQALGGSNFTLTVVSTVGFPTSGSIIVGGPTGGQTVTYTGTTGTTFTTCNGGTGTPASGAQVFEATRTTLTDIVVEDCDFQGGNYGFAVVGGTLTTGASTGINVFYNRCGVNGMVHDTLVVPSAAGGTSNAANVQFGSLAYGGHCWVDRLTGSNSYDVGIEIDAANSSSCTRCVIIDARNSAYLHRNFGVPSALQSQKNVCWQCVAITRNVDKATAGGTGKDFSVNGDGTATYAFGEIVLDQCVSQIETALADWSNTTAMCVDVSNMYVHRVTVRNYRIGCMSLNTAPASNHTYIFNDVWTSDPRGIVEIDGLAIELAGTLGIGNTGIVIEGLRTSSTGSQTTKINIGGVTVDASGLTNTLATNNTLKVIHMGVNSSSFFTGRIWGTKATNGSVGGWTAMNLIILNANFHVGGANSKLQIEDCDSALWTSSAGSDYSAASNQFGLLNIRSIAGRRATGAPFGVPTNIVPGASPYVYQNGDLIPETVIVSAGTVSDISWSHDNSTYFATGQTTGTFRVDTGDFLKVTYSGTPTMTKLPLA